MWRAREHGARCQSLGKADQMDGGTAGCGEDSPGYDFYGLVIGGVGMEDWTGLPVLDAGGGEEAEGYAGGEHVGKGLEEEREGVVSWAAGDGEG